MKEPNCVCCRNKTFNGICFSSSGSFDSEVYDPSKLDNELIELFICDNCLKNNSDIINRYKVEKPRVSYKKLGTLQEYLEIS